MTDEPKKKPKKKLKIKKIAERRVSGAEHTFLHKINNLWMRYGISCVHNYKTRI